MDIAQMLNLPNAQILNLPNALVAVLLWKYDLVFGCGLS